MKDPVALLASLKDISSRLNQLASDNGKHELDPDAIVDLNMARASVDKLINRVERDFLPHSQPLCNSAISSCASVSTQPFNRLRQPGPR